MSEFMLYIILIYIEIEIQKYLQGECSKVTVY